ncbi:CPBP family intramembrane glutamic endopeptidase [Galbibacter sp.]|uniref:CPBP family intramembrane glutamic endopeptidase n=1 Tax=Galbibacter sp. TaxID=2918471 RepID=UPI003A8EA3E8
MESNHSKSEIWLKIIVFTVAFVIFVGLFELFGYYVAGANPLDITIVTTIKQEVIIYFFGLLAGLSIVFMFMRFVDNEALSHLGLSLENRMKDIGLGIAAGLVIMGIGFLALLLLNQITFENIAFNAEKLALSIILFMIVAVLEEIVCRGYILRNLLKIHRGEIALIISSVIFALMHAFNPHMGWISYINLFLSGIVLGLPYILTKNLWFSIALHFSWNFFQALFGFSVSGKSSFSLVNIGRTENNLINGGDFGFEGSIFCVIALLLLIGYMNFQAKSQNNITQKDLT